MKKTTTTLKTELKQTADFDRFLKRNEENLVSIQIPDILKRYIKASGLSKAEISRRSGMSEVYLHQILAGRRRPSRNRALALCIALGLTMQQTEAFLRDCGFAGLYVRNRRDAAIAFAVEKKWTVFDLNEKLFEMGEETIL